MVSLWLAAMLTAGGPPANSPATPSFPMTETALGGKESGQVAALAVDHHGQIVLRRRIDSGAIGDPIDIRSAGKSLTALAVGAAIADGKLAGVDVAVWPFLGAARGVGHDAITVRDLLTMSSALDCDDSRKQSPGQEERMYRTRDWRGFALAIPLRAGYHRDATGFGAFSYCTAGAFLLGQVVEKATGQSFDSYVQQRLLDPLGVRSVVWRRSLKGEVQSGGQLRISDADLLKIGRMVLDGGTWQGRKLLPKSWISEMLHPWRQLGTNVYYGYLWWAMPVRSPRGAEAAWMMQGNGGNLIALFNDYDAVIVVQARNYNKPWADRVSFSLLEAVLADLPAPQ